MIHRKEVCLIGRKLRIWFPGATYHLMNRGIRKQAIFLEEEDYETFLLILEKVLKKTGAKLHAYCLMTNHIHLLIETKEEKVSIIMQILTGDYARYFNRKYGLRGHLFEGRYCSGLIRNIANFMQISRYIHMNPVKAHIVPKPEAYKWSSYRVFLGALEDDITERQVILSLFDNSVKKYQDYVEDTGHKCVEEEEKIREEMRDDEDIYTGG